MSLTIVVPLVFRRSSTIRSVGSVVGSEIEGVANGCELFEELLSFRC